MLKSPIHEHIAEGWKDRRKCIKQQRTRTHSLSSTMFHPCTNIFANINICYPVSIEYMLFVMLRDIADIK